MPNISKKAERLKTLKYNDDTDFNNKNKYDARAGNILYLQSNIAKQIILNNTDISFSDTSSPTIKNAQFDYISMYPEGYSGAVVAFPNLAYVMKFSGSDIIIPNLINPFSLRRLKFILGNTSQKITIQKLNGEDVNIIFNNLGYSNNNIIYFDFNKKQFVNNNESIGSSDLIGNNGDVKITWISNIKQNGLVMLDIIFTVQAQNLEEITVATLPEGYKPAKFVQIANRNNIDLYITNAGEIKGTFANMKENDILRVNAIYLVNT